MKTRAWISALAAAVVLAGCSGGSDEPETNDGGQGATQEQTADPEGTEQTGGGPGEAATPAEGLRDKLHGTDPALCGTNGQEAVTHPSGGDTVTVVTGACTFASWEPGPSTDIRSAENNAGRQGYESFASIGDVDAGWMVVVNDSMADPRAVQEALGGQIYNWSSMDVPAALAPNAVVTLQDHQLAPRCESDIPGPELEQHVVREENRSVSLDVDSCKVYVASPALSDEEIEQVKEQAIAEAEASGDGLFWGEFLVSDPNLFQQYPSLAETEGFVPGYVLADVENPEAMLSELDAIGRFEVLAG